VSGLELITWQAPGPYRVTFSTRAGGVSKGRFASLNLGLLTDDVPRRVEANRKRLCTAAGVDPDTLSWPRQVHGAAVVEAGGRGAEADAIWSDRPEQPMAIVTADCLPVAIVRLPGRPPALALVHAGWRGVLAGVLAAAADSLGGSPLAAVIGPGIGHCCYEVGRDVSDPLAEALGPGLVRGGRLDLAGAAERALRAAGVVRVDRLDACTSCDPARFFSHRRDEGRTGRQGAIGLVA